MIEVTLYSRKDCHLCDQVKADLAALQAEFPHKVVEIDIDAYPELRKRYGEQVPVVEAGPYHLKAPVTRQELAVTLGAVRDRRGHIERIEQQDDPGYSQVWTRADGFTYWMGRHYLALFNVFVLLYVGLPFLAPVLMRSGAEAPASLIYRAYGMVCHQLGYRSFFLFGEQNVFPRAEAGIAGLTTFAAASGLGEGSSGEEIMAARQFVGNEVMGYKVALCQRDVAIYGSILLFGVLYALSGRRIPGLPWYVWILIGIVPIGLDGVSQLVSQPPLNLLNFRESTPWLRTASGFLFGFCTAWFGYPLVEDSMRETRQIMADKLRRVQRSAPQAKTPQ